MSPAAEEKLMLYLDGELAAEDVREVERWLAESAEARAWLAELEQVGAAVRSFAEARGPGAEGIADVVMARVQAEDAGAPALRALPGGAEPGPVRRLWAPTFGVLLAAAAAWVFVQKPVEKPSIGQGHAERQPALAVASVAPQSSSGDEPGPAEPESGASIESVDFGAQNGTIFMVASGPQVTPVVWLVDESDLEGDRMKPL